MSFCIKVKEFLFGKSPEEDRFMLLVYGAAAAIFILAAGLGFAIARHRGVRVPCIWFFMTTTFALFILILIMKGLLAFIGIGNKMYDGSSVGEVPEDDSDIEALIVTGQYEQAVLECRKKYDSDKSKVKPLFRAGEIYWLKLHDYRKAIEVFYEISALPILDNDERIDAITRILELYRQRMPDSPDFLRLSKWVVEKLPNTIAAKIAHERINKEGV